MPCGPVNFSFTLICICYQSNHNGARSLNVLTLYDGIYYWWIVFIMDLRMLIRKLVASKITQLLCFTSDCASEPSTCTSTYNRSRPSSYSIHCPTDYPKRKLIVVINMVVDWYIYCSKSLWCASASGELQLGLWKLSGKVIFLHT